MKPPVVKLDYEKYTLPNGLDVILSEDKRLPMVGRQPLVPRGAGQRGRPGAPALRTSSST